jgi:hypothetical protein
METEEKRPVGRPKKNLEEVQLQFEDFDKNLKDLTLDKMNEAPKLETEPQNKISQAEREKSKEVYLKPFKSISSREKFNEKFRNDYEFSKEYVNFEAENHEIIGEDIELWTKPFAGMPAELWKVPVNKAIWGPRYLAEQIKRKSYHRLVMKQSAISQYDNQGNAYFGTMAAETTIQRLDARPISSKKSLFMGSAGF